MPEFADFEMVLDADGIQLEPFASRLTLTYGSNLGWNQQEGLAFPVAASGQFTYFKTDDTPDFGLRARDFKMEVKSPGAKDPILQWEGIALPPQLDNELEGGSTYTITFRGAGGDALSETLPDIYKAGGTTSFLQDYFELGYANELPIGVVNEESSTLRELMRKTALYVTAYVLEDKHGEFFLLSPRRVAEGSVTGPVRAVKKVAPLDLEINDDEFLVEDERIGLVRNSILARSKTPITDPDPNAGTDNVETVGGDSYNIPAKTSTVERLPLSIQGETSYGNVRINNLSIVPGGQADKVSVTLVSVVDKVATVEIFNDMDLIQGIATISFSIIADVRRPLNNLQQNTGNSLIPARETVGGDIFNIEPRSRRVVDIGMFIEGAESFGDIRIENFTATPGPITDFDIRILEVIGKNVKVQIQNNQDIINGTATVSFSITAEVIRFSPGEEYVVSNANSQQDYLPRGAELIDWYPPNTDFATANAWLDARRALNFRKNPVKYYSYRISMWQEIDELTVFVAELEVGDVFVYNGVNTLIGMIEIQYNPLRHRPYKVIHCVDIDVNTPEVQWILGTRGPSLQLAASDDARQLGTDTILRSREDPPPPVIGDNVVTWKGEVVTWKGEDVTWKN